MLSLETLKVLITETEQKISQSMANHNALIGYMQGLKDMLHMATSVANVASDVMPAAEPVAEVLEKVDGVIDAIDAETASTSTPA